MSYEHRCEESGYHLIIEFSVNETGGMYVPSGTFRCARCGLEFVRKDFHEAEVATAEEAGREQALEAGIAEKEAKREAYD